MFCHTTICSRQAAVVQGGTVAPSSSSAATGIEIR
ncbi:TPA: colicin release lysis protein [Escherichia coli]|nr:colicin release lysis protein [Escherichia coli]HCL9050987.1 colicin release lysis protein [Escherichia coli]HDK2014349.1 colicin release lysis protein [Escherichia coli]